MSTTTLYRFFDHDDRLLYVGISGNPGRRFHQHSGDKPWWGQVARSTMDHFESRRAAELAERRAILDEHPVYNHVHNMTDGRRLTDWEYLEEAEPRIVQLVEEADTTAAAAPYCANDWWFWRGKALLIRMLGPGRGSTEPVSPYRGLRYERTAADPADLLYEPESSEPAPLAETLDHFLDRDRGWTVDEKRAAAVANGDNGWLWSDAALDVAFDEIHEHLPGCFGCGCPDDPFPPPQIEEGWAP